MIVFFALVAVSFDRHIVMVGRKRRKPRVIDPTKISELGKQFFQYVADKDEDWQSNMKKNDLRTCFMEEYKPWLLQDGQKPGMIIAR